ERSSIFPFGLGGLVYLYFRPSVGCQANSPGSEYVQTCVPPETFPKTDNLNAAVGLHGTWIGVLPTKNPGHPDIWADLGCGYSDVVSFAKDYSKRVDSYKGVFYLGDVCG